MVEPQALKRMTWSQLEGAGIHRCCVRYSDGKRCRRRASKAFESTWCDKHGPIMKAHTDWANEAIRKESK